MTQSEEDEEAEWRPWLVEDIVSRHYEYPDEEGPGNFAQVDNAYGEDANMYEEDANYDYGEGDREYR